MIFYKTIISAVTLLVFYLVACNTENNNPYKNNLNIDPATLARIDTPNYTTIKWLDSIIDFGTVKENDTVFANFKFKNVGKTALFIFNVRTSCGCTAADFDKEPIMPGKEGKIAVKFSTHGRLGIADKSISIIANTKEYQFHHLELKGNVVK